MSLSPYKTPVLFRHSVTSFYPRQGEPTSSLICEMKSLSRVQLFATPWTVAYQAPLSMGFSRHEYWSGVAKSQT